MSGFTAPATATDDPIANDGWWPAVDPATCRDLLRIDGTVTAERLRAALIAAIGSVNMELASWRADRETDGADTLADVDAPKVDGESLYTQRYLHAVRTRAGAWLIERYRNLDLTGDGAKKADSMTPSIDELRRDARWAIRDILGAAHTTVELI